ncbi:hypothetical protein [Microlunatus sp. Y2014]|uniref:hypothetical protein n=1 Tax=Microlunatus sp. Y2014 TaxID=3418488 RepID=UPI003DA6E068
MTKAQTTTEAEPKPVTIGDLSTAARAAAEDAKRAAAELAAAEAVAYDQAGQNRHDAEAAWLDTYDPAADRAAVQQATDTLADAIRNSDLGRALIAYAEANETRLHRAARANALATGHGRTAAAQPHWVSIHGRDITRGVDDYLSRVMGDLAYRIARDNADDEDQRVEDSLTEAFNQAGPATPTHWRVTNRNGLTATHDVGGLRIRFAAGVTYIPAEHDRVVAYFHRKPGTFTVTPTFTVPDDWAGFVKPIESTTTQNVAEPEPASDDITVRRG